MIDRKLLLVIVLIAMLSFAAFFSTLSLRERKSLSPDEKNAQQIALAQLEGKMQQLKEMVGAVGENNRSLQQSVSVEKEKTVQLEEKIKEVSAQKESLAHELTKKEEQLTALKEVPSEDLKNLRDQLSAANQERAVLQQKVADLAATVESLKKNGLVPQSDFTKVEQDLRETKEKEAQLRADKQEALRQAQENKENLAQMNKKNQELEKEMNVLKVRLERLNKDYAGLRDAHDTAQLAIKQNEAELAKRTEEITYLKGRLDEAESKAFEVYSKYKEMKKETALLREQSVNVQLEKEGLRDELTLARKKLSDLQNKFQQIDNMIKTEEKASEKAIGVELLPQTDVEQK